MQAPPRLDVASFTPLSRFPAASFEHRPQARWMVFASCRCSEYSRTTASSGTPSMGELVRRPAGPREGAPADAASPSVADVAVVVRWMCLNRTLGGAASDTAPSPVDRADARPHSGGKSRHGRADAERPAQQQSAATTLR